MNYEKALINLAELRHENEKLHKLLKEGKIEMEEKKENNEMKLNKEFEKWKEQWFDNGGMGEAFIPLSSNNFAMKLEVSFLIDNFYSFFTFITFISFSKCLLFSF